MPGLMLNGADLTPRRETLEPIEIASRDEISALQLQRLKWSLAHAYANVPLMIAVDPDRNPVASRPGVARPSSVTAAISGLTTGPALRPELVYSVGSGSPGGAIPKAPPIENTFPLGLVT